MLALAKAGKRIVAAGERGVIMFSDNDGGNWVQASVPTSVTLTAMHFLDAERGWAVGHLGVVLHTTDGGGHWEMQLDGLRAAALARQAVGEAEDGSKAAAAAQALADDGPDKPFLDVHFENEHTGYAVGAYNLAFRTTDAGNRWESWSHRLQNPGGSHLYAVRAVAGGLMIAGEQGLLLRSPDGVDFRPATSPSKGSYFGMLPGRSGELLLYGLRGRAFQSDDSAATWAEVETGTRSSLTAGQSLDDGRLLLASQAGELLVSRDFGKSFRVVHNAALPVSSVLQVSDARIVLATLRGIRNVVLSV